VASAQVASAVLAAGLLAAGCGGDAGDERDAPAPAVCPPGERPCLRPGAVRWSQPVDGEFVVRYRANVGGTVPAGKDRHPRMAVGEDVAVLTAGMTVRGYDARTGTLTWHTVLTGLPAGARAETARVWPGLVTVGVAWGNPWKEPRRYVEVVLDAGTGARLRTLPSAVYTGTIHAGAGYVVVLHEAGVTAYGARDGRVRWTRRLDRRAPAWEAEDGTLFLARDRDGYTGPAPITGIRRST